MTMIESLARCVNPLATATVFNPTRPEYYRAEQLNPPAGHDAEPAVRITLSPQATAATDTS